MLQKTDRNRQHFHYSPVRYKWKKRLTVNQQGGNMHAVYDQVGLIAFFIVCAYIVKYILEYKTRRNLIDKGIIHKDIKHLYRSGRPDQRSSLKWGMVLVGVGAAFLIGQFVSVDIQDEISFSLALILAGLALMIFYFTEGKIKPEEENDSGGHTDDLLRVAKNEDSG
jgi:hypothetical protein